MSPARRKFGRRTRPESGGKETRSGIEGGATLRQQKNISYLPRRQGRKHNTTRLTSPPSSAWIGQDLRTRSWPGALPHPSYLSVMSAEKSTVDLEAPFAAARSSKKWCALAPPLSFPSESGGISFSKDSTSMTTLTPSSRLTKASWWSGTCRRSLWSGGTRRYAGVKQVGGRVVVAVEDSQAKSTRGLWMNTLQEAAMAYR